MKAPHRTVTINVKGVAFEVEVMLADPRQPREEPRRWCVRVAGSKAELDELLDKGVLREIDRRIHGGEENPEDEPFHLAKELGLHPQLTVELAAGVPVVSVKGGAA